MRINRLFYRSVDFWAGLVALIVGFGGLSPIGADFFYWIFSVALLMVGIYELFRGLTSNQSTDDKEHKKHDV
ncbi:hypothetical protein [Levilactobacillus enshiensis]|uniref:hypothetical protein n=1 Tax=Levilactobacillus enshiensis TaxID=2590213 RepID=UPI00117ACAF3|nr:hypothetical protein [Levilactobacillus enshiensis]